MHLSPAMIGAIVMAVVVAGGLIVYFAFVNHSSTTASSCTATLSTKSSHCSPATTSPTFTPTNGSTTTSTPGGSTSTSTPGTVPQTSVPETTPQSTPESTPESTPASTPGGGGSSGGPTVSFGDGITLTIDAGAGWKEASNSNGVVELANSQVSSAALLCSVAQTKDTQISQVFQTDLNGLQQNTQGLQIPSDNLTVQSTGGSHFPQALVTPFTATVSGNQGTEPIAGQLLVLFNPSTKIEAEIIAFVNSQSANYSSINDSVIDMADSMA